MKSTEELEKFKSMSADELKKEVAEIDKKLTLARLNISVNKLTDFSSVAKLKKSVARIKTIMTEQGVNND